MAGASLVGAVEAGGTKFRAAVLTAGLEVVDEARFATRDPASTLDEVIAFFARSRIVSLGIACFGPVDVDPASDTYGSMLATPKPGWSGVRILGPLRDAIGVPTVIDTDVGAAALAEATVGAGVGKRSVCYVTVGTGIGGAIAIDRSVLHGHGHAEFGHVPVARVPGDGFAGSCPFHGDCLEGMASGSAVDARRAAGEEDPGQFIAEYLAQLVQTLTYTLAPDLISFGGGLFHRPELLPAVHAATTRRLAGYTTNDSIVGAMDRYVVRSPLDQDAGLLGAGILAVGATGR
jgi:fructokinase